MDIEKIDHLETMIGSLNKLLLDAKNKGIIRNKELSLLNLIFKLLQHNCYYDLKEKDKNKLLSLYYKILNRYSFLCKSNISIASNIIVKTPIIKEYIDTNPNTPPVIEDPEESNPISGIPAKLCETIKNVSQVNISKHQFTNSELSNCFIDINPPAGTGTIKFMKILTLPQYNPLTYQGINVVVGQLIDLTTLNALGSNGLLYQGIAVSNVNDQFTYQVSTTSFPNIYSETVTMKIKVGNPI